MKIVKLSALLTCFVLFLSGCASGPLYQEYESSLPEIQQNMGRIFLYRTTALGAAVQPKVKIDGEVIGSAKPKGFFFVDRPAGSYVVSASTEAKRSLSITLDAGEEKYVRLEMKMGFFAGHVKPVLVNTNVGKAEIVKTKYIGR